MTHPPCGLGLARTGPGTRCVSVAGKAARGPHFRRR